ncbi:hypothetical protein AAHA92_30448 [Salvia divinorum]|uniref:Uncharacterized protein n=1 Tax=Salvia divinorum TaxID=28513 RepID=A0ABD1FQW8_SALDI
MLVHEALEVIWVRNPTKAMGVLENMTSLEGDGWREEAVLVRDADTYCTTIGGLFRCDFTVGTSFEHEDEIRRLFEGAPCNR